MSRSNERDHSECKDIADMQFRRCKFKEFIDKMICKPTYKYEMEALTPSCWLKSLSGANTWSNREVTWNESNSKFIFGVHSKEKQNEWIIVINYIIQCLKCNCEGTENLLQQST